MKIKSFTLSVLALSLSACSTTQVQVQSSVPVPTAFEQTAVARAQYDVQSWWQAWRDPVLIILIQEGLRVSPDIKIAQSRLVESQAVSGLAQADLGPSIGLGAGAGLHVMNVRNPVPDDLQNYADSLGQSVLGDDRMTAHGNSRYLAFKASWEPDIFGQKRSDADAAHYAELATAERVHGAQMVLASTIADHYLQIRALEKQIRIYQRYTVALNEMQRYVEGRFKAGQTTADQLLSVTSKIPAVQARQATLSAQRNAHERAIAVLLGQVPQGFNVPTTSVDILANLPLAPSGQLPGEVLERRPDVRANARLVQVYSAKLASAKADLLPRFEINFLGSAGRIALDSSTPVVSGLGSIASAGMTLPIFTAGRIQRNIDASNARLQTAILEYDKSILTALSEVENVYQTQSALEQQNHLLRTAVARTRKQADSASALFQYGEITLDTALRAKIDVYDLSEKQIQGDLAQAQNLLNLYKALGGGWSDLAISRP